MAAWVKEHIKSGNHAVVDDYVKRLQEMKPNMKARDGVKIKPPAQNDMMRPDGTMKDVGYYGRLKSPMGQTVTEYSIGVPVLGKEMDVPTLVPGLTEQEKQYILQRADRGMSIGRDPIGNTIAEKAIQHAEQRVMKGLSPFYSSVEEGSRPVMQADATRTTFVKPIYGEASERPIGKTKSVTERIEVLPINPFGMGLMMAKRNKK
jgi:hypothetical protein